MGPSRCTIEGAPKEREKPTGPSYGQASGGKASRQRRLLVRKMFFVGKADALHVVSAGHVGEDDFVPDFQAA